MTLQIRAMGKHLTTMHLLLPFALVMTVILKVGHTQEDKLTLTVKGDTCMYIECVSKLDIILTCTNSVNNTLVWTIECHIETSNCYSRDNKIRPAYTEIAGGGVQVFLPTGSDTLGTCRCFATYHQEYMKTVNVQEYRAVAKTVSLPNSPRKPEIQESSILARSVTVSWIPAHSNGHGPIRNFTVQYRSMSSGILIIVPGTILHTNTSYNVKGLKPNTHYVFQVAATNDVGRSPFSEQSDEVKTLEDAPEGAPRYVRVHRLNSTSVRVSWEQPRPRTWNGQLLGYYLQYRQVGNTNYQEVHLPLTQTTKVLTGLEKFVNYVFSVEVYNGIDRGPPRTSVVIYVAETAPSSPPANVIAMATSNTEIRVTWLPPPTETHNGAVSGYQVAYWFMDSPPESAKYKVLLAQQLDCLLGNLAIYKDYAITVRALNFAGEGPSSTPVYAKTKEGLPDRPALLEFWNITLTSLDVQWAPPETPNGQILNYELSYIEVNPFSGGKPVKFNVSGDVQSLSITKLLDNANYTFRILARTLVGTGPSLVKNITIRPQEGSPGKPRSLTYQIDGSEMILDWIDGSPNYSPIYGHLIQVHASDSPEWQTVSRVGPDTRAKLNLLQFTPDREYQVRVVALNLRGMSPPSEAVVRFKTPSQQKPVVVSAKAFTDQWYFIVIVAMAVLIVILVIVALLCIISHRSKSLKSSGSNNFEANGQSTHHRIQNDAGIRRNGVLNTTYLSDYDTAQPDDDDVDDGDSRCTEQSSDDQPSHEQSSEQGDSAAEDIHSKAGRRYYAYAFDDGLIVLNNTAQSREPILGYSTFV